MFNEVQLYKNSLSLDLRKKRINTVRKGIQICVILVNDIFHRVGVPKAEGGSVAVPARQSVVGVQPERRRPSHSVDATARRRRHWRRPDRRQRRRHRCS